jgi:hypothetical protein
MAYNEEASIAAAMESILCQRLSGGRVAELVVVASGCEDGTAEIVAGTARRDRRVRLIEQEHREGKASAINLFIDAARSPVLVLVGADLILKEGTLEALLRHFTDPEVGMVGGHPTPVNGEGSFLGHAVHLQWRLHDRVARRALKLGEIVAFRNVVPSIPLDTAVDELSIQALVTQLGYRLVYEPEAVVYNRGPATLTDFMRQRRRIYAGHVRVRERQGYSAPTMNAWQVLRTLPGSGSFGSPRAAMWTAGTVGLEAAARALGYYDAARGRTQHVWAVSATTKGRVAEGARAHADQNVAVFHILDFHRQQLEFGAHAARRLTRRVAGHIKRELGSEVIVSMRESGTVVALLPDDREVAERTAGQVVQRLESVPLMVNGHEEPVHVRLACAVIGFPQAGPPLAKTIRTRSVLDADAAVSIAT